MPRLYQHRPVRVLLVEDSDSDASLLVDAATKALPERISWDRVHTGEEALEAAGREKHDLALVDIRLPGMDGYEVLEQLRAVRGKNLPIVMLFGADDINRPRCWRLGAEGIVQKPLAPRCLVCYIDAIEEVWAEDRRRLQVPPTPAGTPGWDGDEKRTAVSPDPPGTVKAIFAALAMWGMR
jgi:DNA-binding response OmpR family regulator